VIDVHDLQVTRGSTQILRGVSCVIPPGSWVAVIGPNGAGKSTLLQAIAGVIASQGRVCLDGTDLSGLSGKERARRLALVPQQPSIPLGLSVTDYVLLGRTPYIGTFSVESRADVSITLAMLDRLDFGWAAGRNVDSLSGGEFQRAVLARALVQEPQVLLLDEPTAALDLGHQQRALELVEERRRGAAITVLSAMHDLTLASQFADRFLLLSDGVVATEGSAPEVLRPGVIERYLGATVRVLPAGDGSVAVVPVRKPRLDGTLP
jgi:iron complex transport system ATP-binding protein